MQNYFSTVHSFAGLDPLNETSKFLTLLLTKVISSSSTRGITGTSLFPVSYTHL